MSMRSTLFRLRLPMLLLALLSPALNAQPSMVIHVTPGYATVIECPAKPELVTLGNVEAFSVQTAGNYVLIKPLISQGTTNMFIKAGAESFNLLLEIAATPDLEVKLLPSINTMPSGEFPDPGTRVNGDSSSTMINLETALTPKRRNTRRQPLNNLSRNVLAVLSSRFKATNRYSYSVNNSKVVFAVDHMKQIDNKLYIIATVINGSSIPYDVGYVQFKLIEYTSNYIFGRKRLKETEMEPTDEFFNPTIKPNSSTRLLFVFDKHGYSDRTTLNIKCYEESGQRDLVLEVPGRNIE